ncbi:MULTISPECIES: undecaprenyl-diphosphate phosphatase [Dyadobacter]|jgi:undecaprenyl-diphosphatase|uniref:Undecaprenyl-diphosphatase n=1 Tax=Dyadobacter chenhuakuii TaxID=2909339 RepID=A0ABY4XPG5_9BACT|nr:MULTISPECIES: undecaprenyl-diphosphate phosphatase [Dyadobacter]MCE7072651.1 undecaprenyl-diphosphate phosphatase [Dyadobacter sp. CY327]MCF2493406.1 undecaprenyl-diphosphate phosphatase [Dyadobacter chenhuakuii]MCF2517211.1 undecaprenyl-diphosphate phosphatase [Dyadobacter sp. CY351]USJ32317.1 undecaprenyl-diphosphate phosphatase [Dyadobacter chenhuakuii]
MSIWQAIILAIVEGITEFLPVSSTGHMIIASSFMGISHLEFTKMFTVNIQFGAILSVLVLYWKRFFQTTDFYFKLFVAFLPAAVIGFLLNDFIDAMLENVVVVAVSLLVGGIILIFIDRIANDNTREREISYFDALKIGFFQCIAMIPGVSRSASTIIGGMLQGLSRKQAAEFSFFLAVPTMAAAGGYKLLKTYDTIQAEDIKVLLIGNAVAFVVAMLAIKFFISFLTKYGFKVFGYYRIILGLILLGLLASGYKLDVV